MLIFRDILRRRLPCIKNNYNGVRFLSAQAKPDTDLKYHIREKLPAIIPKEPKREPFAKNLFIGTFDYQFLEYPEPQTADRYNEFQKWLEEVQRYMKTVDSQEFENTSTIPSHIIQSFKDLGLFGVRINEEYKGWNLLNSEFMQVLETVGTVPALGFFFLKQSVPPIEIFNKFCTVEQKLKYLPKIATGELIATVAVTEDDSGPAANNMDTLAILSKDDKYWILDGQKTFVSNIQQSDVFIVFGYAIKGGVVEKRPETLSAFIISKNSEGVIVDNENIQMSGLKGFNAGKLILNNVKVPIENMIGQIGDGTKYLIDHFSSCRHYSSCLTIPILKNFLNKLTQEVLNRKHFEKMLYETEAAQHIIANLTTTIYAIESVLYLTTAMTDLYIDQDVKLETALVEQFCLQECMQRIQECMWLVGPRVCALKEPYEKMYRDAFTVTNFDTSLIDTKIYSALIALQHFGKKFTQELKQERNLLNYPKLVFKKMFLKRNAMKYLIQDYLHPSLEECASFCDRTLYKLYEATRLLLVSEGTNITLKQIHLQRLSDMAAHIYTYIATLGRASRSYCIGNRNSESEMKMCIIMAYRLERQVDALYQSIDDTEYGNGDYIGNELSKLNFSKKEYIAVHPLQRNY